MGSKTEEAQRLLEEGNRFQREGETDRAIECYEGSIGIEPSAEAHTYLGWMLSFKGRLDEAIAHCKRAIELDPEFGNPYNDIGVYLMQQGQLDDAEPWFRHAIAARRYEPRQFPHINLARLYITRRRYADAIRELRAATAAAPGDSTAAQLLRELAERLNGSLGTVAVGMNKGE